jgi:urea transporter
VKETTYTPEETVALKNIAGEQAVKAGTTYTAKEIVEGFLHGFSQAVLLENKWSGLIILIALFIADVKVGIAAVIGSLLSLVLAIVLNLDKDVAHAGDYGFNGVLTAIACEIFLTGTAKWIGIIIGVCVALGIVVVFNEHMKVKKLPGLVFPFVATTWLILLVSYRSGLVDASIAPHLMEKVATGNTMIFPDVFYRGLGELYLVHNMFSAILFLVALLIDKVKPGMLAICGIITSEVLGYLIQAPHEALSTGLFTYNMILVYIAINRFIGKNTRVEKAVVYIFATFMVLCLDLAEPAVLGLVGLPNLTLAFIVSAWLSLSLGKALIAHREKLAE